MSKKMSKDTKKVVVLAITTCVVGIGLWALGNKLSKQEAAFLAQQDKEREA